MKKFSPIAKDIFLSLISGILLGALISSFSLGNFVSGWLGIGILAALLSLAAIRVWRALGAERSLIGLMVVTFVVRMALGIFLNQGLPLLGFENPVQQSGYVFSDAHDRDQAAYQIVNQGGLFTQNLAEFRAADQYGGLLAASALIYQIFSPNSHRPLIMVMVSAFAMVFGVAFLYDAVKKKWNPKLATAAGWIFALYPEGILLGSSQMREPILLGLTCLLFWVSLSWKQKPLRTLIYGVLITGITCLFSVPGGGAAFIVVAGITFVDWFTAQQNSKTRWLGFAGFMVFLALACAAGWMWLKDGLSFEFFVTESSSGWIEGLVRQYGKRIRVPFITFYGLTQPVLPAALVDPSKPIWRGIAIFRALGWYSVLPIIIYAFFAAFKAKKEENKSLLIFIGLAFAAWVLISSVRAGGDQWDNPRYRTAFLPWMAILAGWAWQRIRSQKCPWFWRILSIEIVFVLFFLYWYYNKIIYTFAQIPFLIMILSIIIISVLIIGGGFIWDLNKNRRKPPVNSEL